MSTRGCPSTHRGRIPASTHEGVGMAKAKVAVRYPHDVQALFKAGLLSEREARKMLGLKGKKR